MAFSPILNSNSQLQSNTTLPNNELFSKTNTSEETLENFKETQETINEEDEGPLGLSGLPIDIEQAIITLNNFYKNEDRGLRDIQIAFWRHLELMWQGITRTFWDATINDWARTVDTEATNAIDPILYDKIINIYKAHGESLIAALSIKLPNVTFYPDDADVIEDIDTAKAYAKIAKLIDKHNNGILIFMKSLYLLFNFGVCFAHIYNRAKSEYGTVKTPKYGEDTTIYNYDLMCPVCSQFIKNEQSRNEPIDFSDEELVCNNCGSEVVPNVEETKEVLPTIVGYNDTPKARTCIEVFGPLYVQVPFYVRKQENTPCLRFKFEQQNTMLLELYPNLKDKLSVTAGTSSYDSYSRSYSPWQYSYSQNLSTVTCGWFRPFSYQALTDTDLIEKMKKRFPNGVYATIINDDLVADGRNECLDEHWQFSINPLSEFVHADPMGKSLAPIQEITTEINDLALETFEHSIPETFADPLVLNFDKYKKSQARPGMMYPAKMPSNRSIGDAFYSSKTATMSEEMKEYSREMDTKGQFVVGSFPSIYGGPAQSGSKTASEYSESRAMALQRLNTVWTTQKFWWAGVMGKAVPLYVNGMISDDKMVEKSNQSDTGFTNIWIKQTELTGKVGQVEPEASEELPTSFAQVKGVLLDLMTLNNDYINEALYHPQNTPLLAKAVGLPELYIPGNYDRDKQYSEFSDLLLTPPLPDGSSTVVPEYGVDDDMVHIQSCKSYLVSSTGVILKKLNPNGRNNIIAHMHMHEMNLQQKMLENQGEKPDSAIENARS